MKIRIALNTDWMFENRNKYENFPATFLANEISKLAACKQVEKNTATEVLLLWEGEDPVNEVTSAVLGILKVGGADGVFSVECGKAPEEPKEAEDRGEDGEDETSEAPEDLEADGEEFDIALEQENPLAKAFEELFGKAAKEGTERKESAPNEGLTSILGRIQHLRAELLSKIKGQEHAVERFTTLLFGMEVHGDTRKKKPRAVSLFAGPPGVGKTYLAETAAELLGMPFLRLDMSGFTDDQVSVESFRGINRSYKAATAGQVTSFVDDNPACVLLFDEIEKAHPNVVQLFLQILEGARCHDAFMDKDVSFEQTVIIFTTNAGRGLYEEGTKKNFSDVAEKTVIEALRRDVDPVTKKPCFPEAILSRLAEGAVIMFNHLEPAALCDIVDGEIGRTLESYRTRFGLKIGHDPALSSALLYAAGGAADARTLKGTAKSFVDGEILDLLQHTANGGADLKEIAVTLDIAAASPEALALFKQEKTHIVAFCTAETAKRFARSKGYRIAHTESAETAKAWLRKEADCVLVDVSCGTRDMAFSPSDPEDVDSEGMDFFRYVRQYFAELPVYILSEAPVPPAVHRTFIRAGAQGVVVYGDKKATGEALAEICRNVCMSRSANALARTRKALSYNCAQTFSEDGTAAEIRLASLKLVRNVSPEDEGSVLSEAGRPDVRFSDVIGAREAKEALREYIAFLKDPRGQLAKGVRAPRGVLLYGPPGTGKTLLARAMAGESDVAFIQKNATEFFHSYVGESPRAVRELFRIARKYAPAVVFIDEVDTVGRMRTGSDTAHAMEEVQNALLSEMDGFVYDETRPVFVLAATNYGVESSGDRDGRVLDPAFVRRFDRKIKVDLPDTAERAQFITYYLGRHGIAHIRQSTVDSLAQRSIGMSPADLALMIEYAVRSMKGEKLTDEALAQALDANRYGEKHEWDEETVKKTSRHEAGHAVVCYYTGETPAYVTNVSRGDFGGYMLHGTDDKKFGYTRQELLDRICCALGGRAAEIVCYGEEEGLTTGASGDLASATDTARRIVCDYGMDDSLVSLGRAGETGEAERARIKEILDGQFVRAKDILRQHRAGMDALVDALVTKNSLTGDEIEKILSAAEKK